MNYRAIISTAFFCASLLQGANWPPIPADVWKLKEESAKGKGAVVLFERIHYGPKRIGYEYRVRIFSEAGRIGAQFADLPSSAKLIEGRTVYPDGREIVFNSKIDMKETVVNIMGKKSKITALEPPGISTDCVVEIRWELNPFDWSDFLGEFRRWLINPIPTLESVVEFSTMFPAARTIDYGVSTVDVKETSGIKSYVFKNLPASETQIFAQRSFNQEPRVIVFSQPPWLRDAIAQGPDRFWEAVGERYFKEIFTTHLSKGWSWSDFSKQILLGLPEADAHTKAIEILLRLDARIANRDELTHEERERFKGLDSKEPESPRALSSAVKRGLTSPMGMYYLAYQLMNDAGLKPKLLAVGDRYEKIVRLSDLNLFQFDHYLLGVETPGKGMLLLDPQDRTLPVGAVSSLYQNTLALCVDTDKWKVGTHQIAEMRADQNLRSYYFNHTIGSEKHTFTSTYTFYGLPEYYERNRYFTLAPVAQVEHFKRLFQDEQSSWTVQKAEVRNAADRRSPISLFLVAAREYENARRLYVDPFPGMSSAVPIPDVIPETRNVPICLGYARTHRATASLSLPEGFQLVPSPAMEEKNPFGRIHWEARIDPSKPSNVLVDYEVVLSKASANSLY